MCLNDQVNRLISSNNILSLITSSPLGVCITDEDGKFVFVNKAYCSLYGYEAEELIGQHFTIVVPEAYKDELNALHHSFIFSRVENHDEALTELQTEWTVLNRQGMELTVIVNAVLLLGKDGRRTKATFVTDITQQKNAEEKLLRANRRLEFHASRDELTGLLNRRAGLEQVSREIMLSKVQSKPLSVAFLDVDYFKKINDVYGHQVGDEVLQQISSLILRGIREGDSAIRYGGEEILIIMPGATGTPAFGIIERLRRELLQERLSSEKITVTFSAGVAEYRGGDRKGFLVAADKALYAAKNGGRNRIVVE
jgi:diguanylate cyclase (GGDEF)-like protein/PAS domain S-box-containing protein